MAGPEAEELATAAANAGYINTDMVAKSLKRIKVWSLILMVPFFDHLRILSSLHASPG